MNNDNNKQPGKSLSVVVFASEPQHCSSATHSCGLGKGELCEPTYLSLKALLIRRNPSGDVLILRSHCQHINIMCWRIVTVHPCIIHTRESTGYCEDGDETNGIPCHRFPICESYKKTSESCGRRCRYNGKNPPGDPPQGEERSPLKDQD